MSRNGRVSGAILAALAIGFVLGRTVETTPTAVADTRTSPAREAFKSGGARSEIVLKEIAGTLGRIEKRVESIEKVVVAKP